MKTIIKLLIFAPTAIAALLVIANPLPNSVEIHKAFAKASHLDVVKLRDILPTDAAEVCAINAMNMMTTNPEWASRALWRKKLTISDSDFHTWSIVWRDAKFRTFSVEIPHQTFSVGDRGKTSTQDQVLCSSIDRAVLHRVSPSTPTYFLSSE